MPEATTREAELSAAVARLGEQLATVQTENKLLREKVDLLLRRLHGASSEQLDTAQLLLMLHGPGKAAEPVAAEAPRRSRAPSPPPSQARRKPRLPEHLPILEEVIVPEPVRACPEAWRCMGEEVTEQLDYEPARFFVRRIVRRKYVPQAHPFAPPVIAPLAILQDRCLAAPGLLAGIIVGKYCDHLPLYRQEQIFRTRHGVDLPRQTMAQWLGLAADWLRPIFETIRTGVLGGGYVQIDETPIAYLAPGHGQTKLGYLWTCARPGGDVVFHWATSRGAACLEQVLPAGWQGTVQCDGYAAYPAFARAHNAQAGQPILTLAGCFAHARRGFFEAQPQDPRRCGWILHQIGLLYDLERRLREQHAGPGLRQAARAAESGLVLRRLRTVLERWRTRWLPQSGLSKAIAYTLDQWPALVAFLQDGRLEIDNNLVENAIRPTALGKKNWLFIGAADAGERGAILYTLVESCRRRGLDPFAYLRDVLTRLPKATNHQVKDLTPGAWAKAQRTATPAPARLAA